MRTHLLRTFYPPSTVEPETGCAANDDDCEGGDEPSAPRSRKPLAIVAMAAEHSANDSNDEHDEYYLGGYAGI